MFASSPLAGLFITADTASSVDSTIIHDSFLSSDDASAGITNVTAVTILRYVYRAFQRRMCLFGLALNATSSADIHHRMKSLYYEFGHACKHFLKAYSLLYHFKDYVCHGLAQPEVPRLIITTSCSFTFREPGSFFSMEEIVHRTVITISMLTISQQLEKRLVIIFSCGLTEGHLLLYSATCQTFLPVSNISVCDQTASAFFFEDYYNENTRVRYFLCKYGL